MPLTWITAYDMPFAYAAEQAGNARDYVQALANAGYATDPAYAQKVMTIFQRPELQQWIADAGAPPASRSGL